MPAQPLQIRPGINTEATQLLNSGGWSLSQLVRFFQGYLQKYGGWTHLITQTLIGTVRAMLSWEDAAANQYIILGSEQALEIYFASNLYVITPVQTTDTINPSFSTTASSPTVQVTDPGSPAAAGNYVNILNPIAVGGLVLQGVYQIKTIIDSNNYDITAASNATSPVSNTGTAAEFTTTFTSSTVKVTLANHGYTAGQIYIVYALTNVGGLTLFGSFNVVNVIDANNFTITVAPATSSATAFENGGDVSLQYFIPNGLASSQNVSGLYGEGTYGSGAYGIGSTNTFEAARLWSFGYWGTDVVASYSNGSVYTWISENGLTNNPAVLITTSPVNINAGIFTAMPQQQVVALGASDGTSATTDQMLVRWSDVADNTDWVASAINQAGSFRIPRGAKIVGGIQGPQTACLWTDVGFWIMQYIGFPLVYGFFEIGQGCGLIGQNAKGVLAGKVYWMSYNQFFVYDGNSVQPLACPVWDKVFQNINQFQAAKIIACPNSFFNEISWCYPSASGSGENDSRVTYNGADGTWTFDPPAAIVRTAWLDQSALLNPLGVDGGGLIQQHENGNDADGTAMTSYAQTGFAKLGAGLEFTFLERIIPDAILQNGATLQFTFSFQDYPNGPVTFTKGPLNFTVAQAANYLIVRGRGRFVSIRVESNDLGSFWRLGAAIEFGQSAGRR